MLDAGFSARSPSLRYSQRLPVASNTANAVPGPPYPAAAAIREILLPTVVAPAWAGTARSTNRLAARRRRRRIRRRNEPVKYTSGRRVKPVRPLEDARRSVRREEDLLAHGGEQRLVDLAVVDRNAVLVAQADDVLALQIHLLRKLFGRQMIRHSSISSGLGRSANKKPTGARARWVSRPFRLWSSRACQARSHRKSMCQS